MTREVYLNLVEIRQKPGLATLSYRSMWKLMSILEYEVKVVDLQPGLPRAPYDDTKSLLIPGDQIEALRQSGITSGEELFRKAREKVLAGRKPYQVDSIEWGRLIQGTGPDALAAISLILEES